MGDYFVAYDRDIETERGKRYENKMLFDHLREFADLDKASRFAMAKLPALLARKLPISSEDESRMKNSSSYVVAAQFEGKYVHESYDESLDCLNTYDVVRCAKHDLEDVVEKLTQEKAKKIIVGIELSLFA